MGSTAYGPVTKGVSSYEPMTDRLERDVQTPRRPGLGHSDGMRRLLAGTVVLAACSTGYALSGDLDTHRARLTVVMVLWWAVAVVTIRWVLRPRPTGAGAGVGVGASAGLLLQRTALVVFVAALVVQLPGLLSPPRSSSDAYRYVWDGRVQLSGTSPYRYAPLDDRLSRLRDPILFPGLGSDDRSGYPTLPLPTDRSEVLARSANDPRTVINRPQVPTIYPPVAQAWFAAVAAVTPWSWGTRGLQAGSALLAAGVAAALAALLRRRGRDPWGALWWAWCPAVVAEAGNGAHVDVLAAGFVVAALAASVCVRARRPRGAAGLAGLLAGLAIAVKLYPAVLLASLFSLRPNASRAVVAMAVATFTVASPTFRTGSRPDDWSWATCLPTLSRSPVRTAQASCRWSCRPPP